eukprot:708637_1
MDAMFYPTTREVKIRFYCFKNFRRHWTRSKLLPMIALLNEGDPYRREIIMEFICCEDNLGEFDIHNHLLGALRKKSRRGEPSIPHWYCRSFEKFKETCSPSFWYLLEYFAFSSSPNSQNKKRKRSDESETPKTKRRKIH